MDSRLPRRRGAESTDTRERSPRATGRCTSRAARGVGQRPCSRRGHPSSRNGRRRRGYAASCLYELADDALLRAVGRLEPDVTLLDSASAIDYGGSWDLAATITHRRRPVPVVMFSAHSAAATEAREAESTRADAAHFAAVVLKPFHLDELLSAVATAAGRSTPFNHSEAADARRTDELVAALQARGATDVRPSRMREWALFRDGRGRLVQLYWWQNRGVYQVGRYRDSGQLVMLGQFVDREAAIDVALPPSPTAPGATSEGAGPEPT